MIVTHSDEDLTKAVWIDLLAPTQEEADRVQEVTGLRVPK
jgi:Mg2+ and Co2+ transporter CorA